jgi:hypothetical protein
VSSNPVSERQWWVLVGLVAVGAVLTWALVRRGGGDEPAPEEHPEHKLERHRLHL